MGQDGQNYVTIRAYQGVEASGQQSPSAAAGKYSGTMA
jgi:hypothetical protein